MSDKENKPNFERRDLLKGLATVPVAGIFLVNLWLKISRDKANKANLLSDLIQKKSAPAAVKSISNPVPPPPAISAPNENGELFPILGFVGEPPLFHEK